MLMVPGKLIYDRFGLTRPSQKIPQAVFYVANGAKPASLPMGNYRTEHSGEQMLNWVVSQVSPISPLCLEWCYLHELCFDKIPADQL